MSGWVVVNPQKGKNLYLTPSYEQPWSENILDGEVFARKPTYAMLQAFDERYGSKTGWLYARRLYDLV